MSTMYCGLCAKIYTTDPSFVFPCNHPACRECLAGNIRMARILATKGRATAAGGSGAAGAATATSAGGAGAAGATGAGAAASDAATGGAAATATTAGSGAAAPVHPPATLECIVCHGKHDIPQDWETDWAATPEKIAAAHAAPGPVDPVPTDPAKIAKMVEGIRKFQGVLASLKRIYGQIQTEVQKLREANNAQEEEATKKVNALHAQLAEAITARREALLKAAKDAYEKRDKELADLSVYPYDIKAGLERVLETTRKYMGTPAPAAAAAADGTMADATTAGGAGAGAAGAGAGAVAAPSASSATSSSATSAAAAAAEDNEPLPTEAEMLEVIHVRNIVEARINQAKEALPIIYKISDASPFIPKTDGPSPLRVSQLEANVEAGTEAAVQAIQSVGKVEMKYGAPIPIPDLTPEEKQIIAEGIQI